MLMKSRIRNIFLNSEFWFEWCAFSNKNNTWWIIVGVLQKDNKKIKLWV